MAPIFRPCSWAKATRSGSRAIDPSSFMISQITPGRVEAGHAGDVDGRLGVAGADQHAAVLGHQREDVARRDDVVHALGRVDGDGDGVGPVVGGDAGGDALAGLDGDGEGGAVAGLVVAGHRRQAQLRARARR